MTSYQRDRDEVKPKRKSDVQIVLALFAGSLLTLLVVFILFGRSLMSLSTPSPTPTLAPTPTLITSSAVVQQIQRLSRLETSSYSIQSVVSAERPGGLLGIGRQKVLVIVQGTVIAGIDLGKLRPEDVTVSPDGKQVTVKLPEAEILSRYLDEGATRVYDHQTGLFTRPDSSLVVEAEQMGMTRVMQAACEGGIMKRATDDGQKALREFLRAVGFQVVQFEDAPIPACPEDI